MAIEEFYSIDPTPEEYWRSIVLFGRNVATYKFALAKSLLDINPQGGQLIKLSDLAPVYAGYIAQHIELADKQATSASSSFLDACRQYNQDKNQNNLVDSTVRLGFNNVIDAFHVVGNGEISKRFFVDERRENDGIRITDEFSRLVTGIQAINLMQEVESRWRLVETAWEIGISKGLLSIHYDDVDKRLFSLDRSLKRQSITSCRSALNGYQKGKCFYCFCDITVNDENVTADVDHFFPHTLKRLGSQVSIDGVWNLVLSCIDCNRGTAGKFTAIPTIKLLERLSRRNEFLITSHHPLRDTLMQQTGLSRQDRVAFLNDFYNKARSALLQNWEPELKDKEYF